MNASVPAANQGRVQMLFLLQPAPRIVTGIRHGHMV